MSFWFIFTIESSPVSKTGGLLVFLQILYIGVDYSTENIHDKSQHVKWMELHSAKGEEPYNGLDDRLGDPDHAGGEG